MFLGRLILSSLQSISDRSVPFGVNSGSELSRVENCQGLPKLNNLFVGVERSALGIAILL